MSGWGYHLLPALFEKSNGAVRALKSFINYHGTKSQQPVSTGPWVFRPNLGGQKESFTEVAFLRKQPAFFR